MASKGWFNRNCCHLSLRSQQLTAIQSNPPVLLSRRRSTLRGTRHSNSSVYRARRGSTASWAGESYIDDWCCSTLLTPRSLAIGFTLSLLGSIVLFLGDIAIFAGERNEGLLSCGRANVLRSAVRLRNANIPHWHRVLDRGARSLLRWCEPEVNLLTQPTSSSRS